MTISDTTIEKQEIERIFAGFTIEAQKQMTTRFKKPKKRVIVLAGPTATGKSALALSLATQYHGEIISADSMQIYRGMDIGTAKPSAAERALVPHHLIDIRDVKDNFNVVDFYYEARHCCQIALNNESIPLVVGGSGFYLHALLFGPPSGPPSVPELRKALEIECQQFGSHVLYERLEQLDPIYAHSITKNDAQKIIRALEIITLTGKKVSKLSWKGRRQPQNYDFHCWFLHRPREVLYKRIEERCDAMLKDGLLDEVEHLLKTGLLENESACQAIGYRQGIEFFNSEKTAGDYRKFVDSFKQASRNYAKRQFTWFRREPLFRWLDLDMYKSEEALDIILNDYEATI